MFIPAWRIDDLMISYAPPGASVGAHIDNYDVFLFQASGRREWSITEDPNADHSYIPEQDIRILSNFEPQQTWVLEPGDLLYLPPGVPHHGVSLDDQCMTWSIGFRAPAHGELVEEIAKNLAKSLPEQMRYADPAFSLQNNSGEISSEAIAKFREIWDRSANPDQDTFARIIGGMLTSRAVDALDGPSDETLPDDDPLSLLDNIQSAEDGWELDSHSRLSFIRTATADKVTLFADGDHYDCALDLALVLTEQNYFEPEQLVEFAKVKTNAEVLRHLVNRGILLVIEPE